MVDPDVEKKDAEIDEEVGVAVVFDEEEQEDEEGLRLPKNQTNKKRDRKLLRRGPMPEGKCQYRFAELRTRGSFFCLVCACALLPT